MTDSTTNDVGNDFCIGRNKNSPDKEATFLDEEYLFHDPTTRFGRVVSLFEFRLNGAPVTVDIDTIPQDGSSDLEVVGMVGTIYNKEGLFGQCGWFGGDDLDWFWASLKGICKLEPKQDPRFRRGEWCMWLQTHLGEYAMLLPHETYRDLWEETLHRAGSKASSAMFKMWPVGGVRPGWWPDRWKEDWPFEKEVGSKRRASTDIQEHEAMERQLEPPPGSWSLIGAGVERQNQGQMWNNLEIRSAWLLEPAGYDTIPADKMEIQQDGQNVQGEQDGRVREDHHERITVATTRPKKRQFGKFK